MRKNQLGNIIFTLSILSFLISCNDSMNESMGTENLISEVENESLENSEKRTNEVVSKVPVDPRGIEVGWQILYEYEFDHYVAKSEFGIWPTEYRQYAGSSGDPDRIAKLNELHSKWGFNYIAAYIGVLPNITAIEAAGFPKETNYMAIVEANQAGRDAVANVYNGLSPNDYFWAYYTDEPYSNTDHPPYTQSFLKSFRDYVVQLRPISFFGFGEVSVNEANRYTHDPYYWYGVYHPNYHVVTVNFISCTRYWDYFKRNDQRPLWTELKNKYESTFSRTWISANLDGSEFSTLLGYCKNNNIAPWLFQALDANDLTDGMISQYCDAARNAGFLDRYDKKYKVWYKCTLTHSHDPAKPYLCNWVEDRRVLEGIYFMPNNPQ
ncbi:MAG: hypothetical protein C4543_03690 [Ignavibacteriales bacterium]|nr:MAG: hypothetical protein C4543_03690 [Ignavibacteriales bacterium]